MDSQLASKFDAMSPKYADLLQFAALGKKTYGERMAGSNAADSFLLSREKEELKADLQASEEEVEVRASMQASLQAGRLLPCACGEGGYLPTPGQHPTP